MNYDGRKPEPPYNTDSDELTAANARIAQMRAAYDKLYWHWVEAEQRAETIERETIERCAMVCEDRRYKIERSGELNGTTEYSDGARNEVVYCAISIRALAPAPTGSKTENDWWMIYFDDQDRRPEIFTEEAAARYRYKEISASWNAHLFKRVDSNSRDFDPGLAPAPNESEPLYKHYKGDIYRILHVAHVSDNARVGERAIVYCSSKGQINVRGEHEFNEPVMWPDGIVRPRFAALTPNKSYWRVSPAAPNESVTGSEE